MASERDRNKRREWTGRGEWLEGGRGGRAGETVYPVFKGRRLWVLMICKLRTVFMSWSVLPLSSVANHCMYTHSQSLVGQSDNNGLTVPPGTHLVNSSDECHENCCQF